MSKRDYYEILSIPKTSSASEIKKAYLKLAKRFHPDANPDDENAEKKFKEAGEAHDILKDPQKRAAYDKFGHAAFENGGMGSRPNSRGNAGGGGHRGQSHDGFHDEFNDFFSNFMGGGGSANRQRSSQMRGSDLKYNLSISLEDAFCGVDKKINFSTEISCETCSGKGSKDQNAVTTCGHCKGAGAIRMQHGFFTVEQTCANCNGNGSVIKNPCNKCSGSGRRNKQKHLLINIPAGIESDTRMRISGEGESGIRGGPSGDLYVFINIKEHDVFKVEGHDLHIKLPIKFSQAALGAEVVAPTIDGKKISLKVPAGSETGDRIQLKNLGMSRIRSSMRGNMYAHVQIKIPKKLSGKQKKLLEELDKELGNIDTSYKDEGFFSKMKSMWS